MPMHSKSRARPPFYNYFSLRVKLNSILAGSVQVPKEGILPARKREVSDGSRDAYIHPDHAAFHLSAKLPRRSPIPGEDARRVAVAGFVNGSYGLVEPF